MTQIEGKTVALLARFVSASNSAVASASSPLKIPTGGPGIRSEPFELLKFTYQEDLSYRHRGALKTTIPLLPTTLRF